MTATRNTSQRRVQISELVRLQGSVQVAALARRFGVSLQTVRKDLRYLSERGVMARAYGGAIDHGAIAGPQAQAEPNYETKRTSRLDEKRRIGRRAAALVQAGDTIAIDSGTTGIRLAEALPDIDITVVTNDFGALAALASKREIRIVMLGGELRRKNMAFYGGLTVDALDALHVDRLFLAWTDSTWSAASPRTTSRRRCSTGRWWRPRAWWLPSPTGSKFGRVCLHRILPISGLDTPDHRHRRSRGHPPSQRGTGVRVSLLA